MHGLPRQRAQTSLNLVSILRAAANARKGSGPDLAPEAFQAAQWAVHSKTSAAIQQLSVRFAAGSDALAKLVREQQDLVGFWRDRDRALIQAIAGTKNGANPETDGLRRQIASVEERLSAIAQQLEAKFPTYATLASPRPLSIEELKGLLSSDEALVFYSVGENGTSAFAATRDGFAWAEIPLGAKELADKVGRARVGLGVDVAAAVGEKKLFDMGVAHELYTAVLAPFEKLVAGKKHLLVVPTGALTSLPFHLLITAKPSIAQPSLKDLSAYQNSGVAGQAARHHRPAFRRKSQSASCLYAQCNDRSEVTDRIWGSSPFAHPPSNRFQGRYSSGNGPLAVELLPRYSSEP